MAATSGAVPLIGRDCTRSPRRRRNSSGEALTTSRPASGTSTRQAYGAGLPSVRTSYRPCRSAGVLQPVAQDAAEVDLVDLPGGDPAADLHHAWAVSLFVQRALPGRVEVWPAGARALQRRRPHPVIGKPDHVGEPHAGDRTLERHHDGPEPVPVQAVQVGADLQDAGGDGAGKAGSAHPTDPSEGGGAAQRAVVAGARSAATPPPPAEPSTKTLTGPRTLRDTTAPGSGASSPTVRAVTC